MRKVTIDAFTGLSLGSSKDSKMPMPAKVAKSGDIKGGAIMPRKKKSAAISARSGNPLFRPSGIFNTPVAFNANSRNTAKIIKA